MEHEEKWNPNLNGVSIAVRRHSDHTYVDGLDEIVGAQLLSAVFNAISGESDDE